MGFRNNFVKFTGRLFVFFLALFESYLISLLFVSIIASAVCSVWSFITPIPQYIGAHFGVLILQGAIPVSVGICIYLLRKAYK